MHMYTVYGTLLGFCFVFLLLKPIKIFVSWPIECSMDSLDQNRKREFKSWVNSVSIQKWYHFFTFIPVRQAATQESIIRSTLTAVNSNVSS